MIRHYSGTLLRLLLVAAALSSFSHTCFSQGPTISGVVTSSDDQSPLPGVNIVEKGTTNGTTTDADGRYTLVLQKANSVVTFSFIGYTAREIAVDNQTEISVSLALDTKTLDEIVVVGYGTVKKRDLTGAVTVVKPDDIRRTANITVGNLLQGQVAGVVVTSGSGAPGAGNTIRIRGTNSINAGNDPLYVIDGVLLSTNDSKISGYTSDAQNSQIGASTLAAINPADIESIEVLKDASATAIYGARGANGVILITTKKGKAGTSVVSFDVETGIQRAQYYKLLSPDQFEQLNREARQNSVPALAPVDLSNDYNTDWQRAILRDAPMSNYALSARGGTEKVTYNLSLNYLDQDGVGRSNSLKRYSVRINLDNQATKWLKIGTQSSLTRQSAQTFRSGNYTNALRLVPNQPAVYEGIYSRNTDEAQLGLNLGLSAAGVSPIDVSPIYDIEQTIDPLNITRILTSNYAEITFLKNFRFRTSLNVDILDTRYQLYSPTTGLLNATGGNAFTAYANILDYLFDNTLTYSKTLADHSVTAVVGQNIEKHTEDGYSARGQNLNDATTFYSYAGNTLTDVTTITNPSGLVWTMASFLGRVNYSFRNRYLVTASLRADGSSRFGAGNKFGYFPSASVGWIISDESFMANLKEVSQLKLRAGYGETGNQEIGLGRSLANIGTSIYPLNNVQQTGRQPSNSPNSDLSWESTAQTNIGLDVGLFSNRISLTADVYSKKTNNLLYNLPLPTTTGFANLTTNIGNVTNRGWELSITSQNTTGQFGWSTNLNVSRNENRITRLGGKNDVISGNNILREGEAIGAFYGYVFDGIFQVGDDFTYQPNATPGEVRFRKMDTSPTAAAVINAQDRVIIGNNDPVINYGVTNNFSWKSLDLSIFLQGVYGNDIYNATRAGLSTLSGRLNVLEEAYLNRWTAENPSNFFPKPMQAGSRNNYAPGLNSQFIEDGSYLRVKNITLGYTLPRSLHDRIGMSSFRIYASVQNLATITRYKGLNPDIGSVDSFPYPTARTMVLGLSTQF